jgi:hypothetical protein
MVPVCRRNGDLRPDVVSWRRVGPEPCDGRVAAVAWLYSDPGQTSRPAGLAGKGGGMTQLSFRSATELAAPIRGKEISSAELAEYYPDRIEALNPGLDAVVTAAAERACPEAGEAGRRLARGEEAGPLHGLPMTAKDRVETAGMRATCGRGRSPAMCPATMPRRSGGCDRGGLSPARQTCRRGHRTASTRQAVRDHQQPMGCLANPGRFIRRCAGGGGRKAASLPTRNLPAPSSALRPCVTSPARRATPPPRSCRSGVRSRRFCRLAS